MTWLPRTVRLGGLLTTAAVLAGMGVTGVAASAAPAPVGPALVPAGFTLVDSSQSFTSSTGKKLTMVLTATHGSTMASMAVTVAHTGSPESHTWTFQLPNPSDITYDTGTGLGSLKTGTSIGKFGTMNLSLKSAGKVVSVGCGRTRTSQQPVTVTGTLTFKTVSTGAARWGQVAGTTPLTFTGQNVISIPDGVDKLCGSTLPPCVIGVDWEAHNIVSTGFTQLVGDDTTTSGVTSSTITAFRTTNLTSPAGAVRTDHSTIAVSAPTFSASGTTAKLTVPASGPLQTGSATFAGSNENAMPALACGLPGQESAKTAWQATYTNGAQPLTVHAEINGNFHLTNVAGESSSANAGIDDTVMK
jgi:hypothetical protein